MELKDRIAAARKHANLSQKQLAERAGVAQQTISALEGGRNKKSTYLMHIAELIAQMSPAEREATKALFAALCSDPSSRNLAASLASLLDRAATRTESTPM